MRFCRPPSELSDSTGMKLKCACHSRIGLHLSVDQKYAVHIILVTIQFLALSILIRLYDLHKKWIENHSHPTVLLNKLAEVQSILSYPSAMIYSHTPQPCPFSKMEAAKAGLEPASPPLFISVSLFMTQRNCHIAIFGKSFLILLGGRVLPLNYLAKNGPRVKAASGFEPAFSSSAGCLTSQTNTAARKNGPRIIKLRLDSNQSLHHKMIS